jgi:hypothetical protein
MSACKDEGGLVRGRCGLVVARGCGDDGKASQARQNHARF